MFRHGHYSLASLCAKFHPCTPRFFYPGISTECEMGNFLVNSLVQHLAAYFKLKSISVKTFTTYRTHHCFYLLWHKVPRYCIARKNRPLHKFWKNLWCTLLLLSYAKCQKTLLVKNTFLVQLGLREAAPPPSSVYKGNLLKKDEEYTSFLLEHIGCMTSIPA